MRLRVPSNINVRKEIWRGLRIADAVRVAIAGMASTVMAVTYVNIISPNAQLWATLFVIIVTGTAFIFFQRIDNLSPYELMKIRREYLKSQQSYLYKRGENK